jgi:hypothetical protein
MTHFGEEELQAGWRVKGHLGMEALLYFSTALINLVGMVPDGAPDIRVYPNNGRGGNGIQIYQPLFESWLIISTWPDHGFVRVNLSSCKPFDFVEVGKYLVEKVGPIMASWSNQL